MSSPVTVTETDTHVLISMDDGKANALSFAMLDALNSGLDQAQAAQKVVLLSGRPGRFSAGFDLSVMARQDSETLRLLRTGAGLAVRLMRFDTPVVAAVSGHALAMGALLCLSVDYRLGVEGDFKLGLNEVAIGMTLPWFGVELARDRLAPTHFNRAVGLARIYTPAEAVEAGYLDEIVPPESFMHAATQVAEGLAQLDMKAHCETKSRVRAQVLEALDAGLERDFAAA